MRTVKWAKPPLSPLTGHGGGLETARVPFLCLWTNRPTGSSWISFLDGMQHDHLQCVVDTWHSTPSLRSPDHSFTCAHRCARPRSFYNTCACVFAIHRTCPRCTVTCASWCSQWQTGEVSTVPPSSASFSGSPSLTLQSSWWATRVTWCGPVKSAQRVCSGRWCGSVTCNTYTKKKSLTYNLPHNCKQAEAASIGSLWDENTLLQQQ